MKKKPSPAKRTRRAAPATQVVVMPKAVVPSKTLEKSFAEVVSFIQQARQRAFQTVNTLLIDAYWQVEYALSRALSPALVAEYQARVPDKKLLQAKMHEFYQLQLRHAEE